MSDITDKKLIKYTEFVATKFDSNHRPWVYTRDRGDLVHIRYRSDFTGYNHWTKRLRRAIRAWNPKRYWRPTDSLDKTFSPSKKSVRHWLMTAWIGSIIEIRKEKNLPDGTINGIITHWEEDGEYIAMMGPTVGVKVLDFLKADPDNEYAKAILTAMHEAYQANFGRGEDDG